VGAARRVRRLLAALLVGSALPVGVMAVTRQDAIFILGADAPREAGFHAAARAYYEAQRRPGDLLVTGAASWSEVRELLARSGARGNLPWGRVVLVVHGSEWTGLDLPVFSGAERPRASELDELLATQAFPALPSAVLDRRSTLVIESCGLGRRPDLLSLYARLLSGRPDGIEVEASSGLVEFSARLDDASTARVARHVRHYVAKVEPRRRAATLAPNPARGVAPAWLRIPINLRMPLSNESCRPAAARRLARVPAVGALLRDYAIPSAALHWVVERRSDGCALLGHGAILTSELQPVMAIGR
jgi:hypothetical protein